MLDVYIYIYIYSYKYLTIAFKIMYKLYIYIAGERKQDDVREKCSFISRIRTAFWPDIKDRQEGKLHHRVYHIIDLSSLVDEIVVLKTESFRFERRSF